MQIALGLLAALLLIAANALFVCAEFALVAVERERITRLAESGNRRARIASRLLRRLSFHLSGAQLGITVTSLVLGFVAEPTIARAIRPLLEAVGPLPAEATFEVSIVLALALATGTQMVFGELVPKGYAIAKPVSSLLVLADVVRVYGIVFGPLIRFLNAAADRTVRAVGIEPKEELIAVRSLEELELTIRSSGVEGTLDPEAVAMLTRSIRFADKTAADALVPRGAVASLRRTDTVADLVEIAERTGHSRFPIRGTDIHDVVGIVHVKDILRIPADRRPITPVTEIMGDAPIVPETRDLESLLLEMRAEGTQLAVVVDEYGSTAGIITLEDLLEEIVGEIEDEYDPSEGAEIETQAPISGVFEIEGTLHAEEVVERTGFEMPEGDYKTIAGFLLTLFERIPDPGDRVHYHGWAFQVRELDGQRIARVRLVAPEDLNDEEDAQ